jgi:chromosome partitioning protein
MPAKVITIAQQKGGAGKTTLAAQLAVAWWKAGLRVAMLDVDPQGSLAAWFDERLRRGVPSEGMHLVQVSGWRLSAELDRLRREFDLVIIDSPPHAETDARVAVRAAELIVVPVQPSPMDLWATRPTLDLAVKERAPAVLVLNRVPPRGKMPDAIRRKIEEDRLPLAQCSLGNRAAFAASMMDGKGVAETGKDSAAGEIQALADEIGGMVGLRMTRAAQ